MGDSDGLVLAVVVALLLGLAERLSDLLFDSELLPVVEALRVTEGVPLPLQEELTVALGVFDRLPLPVEEGLILIETVELGDEEAVVQLEEVGPLQAGQRGSQSRQVRFLFNAKENAPSGQIRTHFPSGLITGKSFESKNRG